MRICIDIDGTICKLKQPGQAYENLQPIAGAASRIRELREQGAYIIFYTARHMKTCDSNLGKVMAREGQTLTTWLQTHGFVYDELWLGKPPADIYIDDKALKFEGSWIDIDANLIKSYL